MSINLKVSLVALMLAVPGMAWDRHLNPDRVPSIGLDLSNGKLPAMLKDTPAGDPHTDGGFVRGALDLRYPVTNALTFKVFGNSTGVNNNLQFSSGHEIGFGLRIYLQD